MSARVVLAVAVAFAAAPAWADEKVAPSVKVESHATPSVSSHSSSSSSSSSSDSGAFAKTHTGRPSGTSAGRPGGGRSGGGDRGTARPRTDAQARHPRPGTGTGRFDDDYRGNRYGGGYRGNGYRGSYGYRNNYGYRYGYAWGSPFYGGYGRFGYYDNPYDSWYSPYYYSGYYGSSPSYYRRARGYGYRDSGSVRILVDPERTRVYVDGYYAGIVDDYDGILQRLNIPPGRHEITLKLEGYRTQHFRVYVPVEDTIKIHFDMVRGTGEATSEEFAGRPGDDYARIEDMDDRDRDRDGDRDDRGYERDRGDSRDRGYGNRDRRDDGDSAGVRLQVSPRDASVYVDGEFRGSGRDSSDLRLRPGRHRIEVVRPGYRTIEREIDVQAGRGADVAFDLERL